MPDMRPGAAAPQGLEQFREEHGRYPDLVVLHSNYWDIAQIVLFRWWEAWEPEYVALMADWLARADKAARFLQVRAAAASPLARLGCPLFSGKGCHWRCCAGSIASQACRQARVGRVHLGQLFGVAHMCGVWAGRMPDLSLCKRRRRRQRRACCWRTGPCSTRRF